jgi:hypothetical protein
VIHVSTARAAHGRHALVLVLLALLWLAACGRSAEDGDQTPVGAGASSPVPPTPSPSADDPEVGGSGGTQIQMAFGDSELTARLDRTATARDLADQLPLTLTFRDHNGVEKSAPLRGDLSLDGAPDGHDPTAGDIGYWAPDGDLVFYYDDGAPYIAGIVRIGEIEGDPQALVRQSADFEVTIERTV